MNIALDLFSLTMLDAVGWNFVTREVFLNRGLCILCVFRPDPLIFKALWLFLPNLFQFVIHSCAILSCENAIYMSTIEIWQPLTREQVKTGLLIVTGWWKISNEILIYDVTARLCRVVWVWNFVPDIEGGTQTEGVLEYGVEGYTWA